LTRPCVRDGDIVGRLGGDELLVLCRQIKSEDEVLKIAERIKRCLSEPVSLTLGSISLRASTGVCSSRDGIKADALVALADAAMYESKRQGTGNPVLYWEVPDRV